MDTLLDLLTRQLDRLLSNWRTTVLGLVAIFAGLAEVGRILLGESDPDLLITTFAAIAAGFGLIFGRDADDKPDPLDPPPMPPRGI